MGQGSHTVRERQDGALWEQESQLSGKERCISPAGWAKSRAQRRVLWAGELDRRERGCWGRGLRIGVSWRERDF